MSLNAARHAVIARPCRRQQEAEYLELATTDRDENNRLPSKLDATTAQVADLTEDVEQLRGELATMAKEQAQIVTERQKTNDYYERAKGDLEHEIAKAREAWAEKAQIDALRQKTHVDYVQDDREETYSEWQYMTLYVFT